MSYLEALVAEIIQNNKLQSRFIARSLEELNKEELFMLNTYLYYVLENGMSIPYLAECYNLIVKDTLREQIYFQKNRKYRFTSFEDVSSSVYFNDRYMRMYMHGLALTYFFWPNHRNINRWFIKNLPRDKSGYYLEIGPGHGFSFMMAMKYGLFNYYTGIDISPTSAELSKSILAHQQFENSNNYTIITADFLSINNSEKYDAIIMGEVLEHVEKPELFLTKIHTLANKNAFIFITTAINSPAIDHIYHFKSVDSVVNMVNQCGFKIKDQLILPYSNMSIEDSLSKEMPINIALIIEA